MSSYVATFGLLLATGVALEAPPAGVNGGPLPSSPRDVAALVRAGRLAQARVEAEEQEKTKARIVVPTAPAAVKSVAWSSDGRRLLVGYGGVVEGDGRGVSVVDGEVWRETMRLLENDDAGVDGVAISPDGTLATGSFNGLARLWKADGRPRADLDCGHGGGEGGGQAANGASGVSFSADGRRVVAACSDGTVRVWELSDASQPALARTLELHAAISALAFSSDGQSVAWGTWDGQLAVTTVASRRTHRLLRRGPTVNRVAFDAAGAQLVSSDKHGAVRVWAAPTWKPRQAFKVASGVVVPAAISPDGNLIVTGGPDGLIFWDAANGVALDKHSDVAGDLPSTIVAFRPDGALLAVGSPQGLTIWDVARRTRVTQLPSLAETGITDVAFSPNNGQLATAVTTGTARALRFWRLSAKGERTMPTPVILPVEVTGGPEAHIVFSGADGSAQFLTVPGATGPSTADLKGTTMAYVDPESGAIAILDGAGKRVRTLAREGAMQGSTERAAAAVPRLLALSPDGGTLATAAEDGTVALWNTVTGDKRPGLRAAGSDAISGLAVSTKGSLVAVATTRGGVEIWDTAARVQQRGVAAGPGIIRCLAFSPDGAHLAVGLTRGGTLLFDLPSGVAHARLTSLARRDARFIEPLPDGPITGVGADAASFMACRAGRFVLPAAACEAR